MYTKYMGRRSKKDENGGLWSFWSNPKEETLRGVTAVVFFVVAILFLLSAFDLAGVVGRVTFKIFKLLFGVGYFLIPILFLSLTVSFFRNLKRRFAGMQVAGSVVFFLSALGLIQIFSKENGGVVGKWIGTPILSLFDIYAGSIILIALLVISFLITFDTALRIDFLFAIRNLFKRKESSEEPMVLKTNIPLPEAEDALREEFLMREEKLTKKYPEKEEGFVPLRSRTLSLRPFTPPPLSLLEKDRGKPGVGDIKANANIIKRTLQNFGIAVEMDEVSIGPSVTRYALKPAEGVKLSRILSLQNNLELALAAHPVRIEAPIPGKSLVGIEIPNNIKSTVGLGTLLEEEEFRASGMPLLVSLGKDISGKSRFANIGKMPHLLIAGATGSGKSVTIHSIIASLLFRNSPENLKFIMIDPKRVELTLYNSIPHLLTPVVTNAKNSILALKWAAKEMDRRYDILEENSVRDIESYHKNILEPAVENLRGKKNPKEEELPETMPYIFIVIDELADIMQIYPRELESAIVRLSQMSRAVGIHLILSTQRPSVNIITGLIKANIPSRIALQVASQVDSRTILDMAGAEKLLGAGDMLYISGEMSKPARIQSAFISESEVKALTKYLAMTYESDIPHEIDFSQNQDRNAIFESQLDGVEDDLYEEARETVMAAGKASTSYLQRKLGVGYARAARLIDMLEERGVVGPGSGAKPREVLATIEGREKDNIDNDDGRV